MEAKFLVVLLVCQACSALPEPDPAKLLRVPKIYNALITTKQKLVASEAYPATTGQVFEPIGLSGEPVLLNPEAFAKKSQDAVMDRDVASAEMPRPFAASGEKKMPAPLVFYPKYSVYHPYQPLLPYSYPAAFQQPLVYSFGEAPSGVPLQNQERAAAPSPQMEDVPSAEVEERKFMEVEPEEEEAEDAGPSPPMPPPSFYPGVGYVKNNRPMNLDIPDVPPPPPPVGAAKPLSKERPAS